MDFQKVSRQYPLIRVKTAVKHWVISVCIMSSRVGRISCRVNHAAIIVRLRLRTLGPAPWLPTTFHLKAVTIALKPCNLYVAGTRRNLAYRGVHMSLLIWKRPLCSRPCGIVVCLDYDG